MNTELINKADRKRMAELYHSIADVYADHLARYPQEGQTDYLTVCVEVLAVAAAFSSMHMRAFTNMDKRYHTNVSAEATFAAFVLSQELQLNFSNQDR